MVSTGGWIILDKDKAYIYKWRKGKGYHLVKRIKRGKN